MRRFPFLILFTLLLMPRLGAAADSPVVRLADHQDGAAVRIPASGRLTIDFTGTSLLDDPAIRLLVIQLQTEGRSDYYSLGLEPARPTYLLNAETLRPHDAPPFPGFRPGGAVYLLLGKEISPGSLRQGLFDARWQLYPQVR